jgi:hypothetical protein
LEFICQEGGNELEFNDIATKSTCEMYTLKIPENLEWRCIWAKIIIDENAWMFSCISDAGNFSYRWPSESHRTFKKFLTQIDMGYLMRKIEPRAEEFNYEETIKRLKKWLFQDRREGIISKESARSDYTALNYFEYENSPDLLMNYLVENTKLFSEDYSYTAEHFKYDYTPEAITFTEVVFPLLQEALKIELNLVS